VSAGWVTEYRVKAASTSTNHPQRLAPTLTNTTFDSILPFLDNRIEACSGLALPCGLCTFAFAAIWRAHAEHIDCSQEQSFIFAEGLSDVRLWSARLQFREGVSLGSSHYGCQCPGLNQQEEEKTKTKTKTKNLRSEHSSLYDDRCAWEESSRSMAC
jgi:hypothetical protein